MSAVTSIEWTEATWNPTTGCDRISSGCDNCYALRAANRLKAMGQPKYQRDGDPRTSGPGFGVTVHPDTLTQPLRWRKPRMIFVDSMGDLFHDAVPDVFIAQVFDVMEQANHHTFQVLTKRHARMRAFVQRREDAKRTYAEKFDTCPTEAMRTSPAARYARDRAAAPPAHIWLGVSIETQQWANIRIPVLVDTPAAVRFVSAEPLLGPLPSLNLTGVDWVIAGGESGPGSRSVDLDWVRQIRDRCRADRIPFLFKQVGGPRPKAGGRLLDGRTWDEYPDLTPHAAGGAK